MRFGYIPLRVRTSFSGGGISVKELLESMKEFSFIPIADIGGIWGWGKLKMECKKEETKGKILKPLFGAELSLNGDRFLLFVKEKEGYNNLCKFLNRRESNGKGLVAIYIPSSTNWNPILENFDDLYIGLTLWNIKWKEIFKRLNIPIVWANPVNFFENHTLYSLILSIRKGIPFPRLKNKNFSFFSPLPKSALRKLELEDEIFIRTYEIAEKCNFDLKEIIPDISEGEEELRKILRRKADELNLNNSYRERLENELKAIEEAKFSYFFLLAHEITSFAREKGILYNLRGSGASSLVAYILGISHIDPMKEGLYFERFLNGGRNEPPDLDIDFESGRRNEVLNYVFKKYPERASFIASFKDFKARSAIYFTGKALGLSPSECRELTKNIPFFAEPSILKIIPPPPGAEYLWRLASLLQGIHFQKSLHIGGVIFTPSPITSYLPIEISGKGYPMTHLDKESVEESGIIKIDLLGARGLSTISETLRRVKIKEIPYGDRRTFDLIGRGETIGCFQIESPAMIDLLRKIKPRNISELADCLALIRPGPTESGMKRSMVMMKKGRKIEVNPILKRLLPERNGLIIYEEQIMEIAHKIGFGWEEAEALRRGLKKGGEEGLRLKFFEKGREKGFEEREIEEIWGILKYFSSYTFNKAHACSYAWSAYISAFLKANYPLEFFASLLNSGGGYYPLWEYIEEAKRRGIKILPPDVCKSDEGFKLEGDSLRKGLLFIKGIKRNTAKKIVEERKSSPFSSLYDFLIRVKPGKEEFFSLIEAGALDSLAPLSSQLSFYLGTLKDIEILKDSRKIDEDLKDILGRFSGKFPFKIKSIPAKENERVSIPVRIIDARIKKANGRDILFFLFEDETGVLEGYSQNTSIPESRVGIVRGVVKIKEGTIKLTNCDFSHSPWEEE